MPRPEIDVLVLAAEAAYRRWLEAVDSDPRSSAAHKAYADYDAALARVEAAKRAASKEGSL